MSMTFRGPLQLLYGSSFLNSVAIMIKVGTLGSFFRFLDTLFLSLKVHLTISGILLDSLLIPSLVKTCFKSTIPYELQVPPFWFGGYSVEEPVNVFKVAKFNECLKVDGG
jgi:hypothetical protein